MQSSARNSSFLSPAYNYYNYIIYILHIIIIISTRPNYLMSYVIDALVKDVFMLIHRATNMNEHSSRSHAIFIITIECSEVNYISVLYFFFFFFFIIFFFFAFINYSTKLKLIIIHLAGSPGSYFAYLKDCLKKRSKKLECRLSVAEQKYRD